MAGQKNSLAIRTLEPSDAALTANFLRSQSAEYSRFFYAFGFDEQAIAEMLSASHADVYSGIFWQGNLIGMFMLRGWDAGYEIPSLGVFIDEKYRGNSLLKLIFDAAKIICRLSGVNRYMIKVHPDNLAFKNVNRIGFYQTGVEEKTGNLIYHIDF